MPPSSVGYGKTQRLFQVTAGRRITVRFTTPSRTVSSTLGHFSRSVTFGPLAGNQYGLALGGPMGSDEVSFILTAEEVRQSGFVNGNVLVPLPGERTPLTEDPELHALIAEWIGTFPAELPNRTQRTRRERCAIIPGPMPDERPRKQTSRARRVLLIAGATVGVYLLLGTIIHNVVLPERVPPTEQYLQVGTRLDSVGEGFRQVVTRMEGGLIWTRLVLEPNAPGPPEHVHTGFGEFFQVTEGTLSVLYNGEVRQLGPGDELDIPPGTPHKPFNTTDQPVVVEGEKGPLPAEFGLFLLQAYAFFDGDPANSLPPRALFQMSLFSPRYELWMAGPPIVLQRVFFGLIAPTARLLGYRSFYE